MNTGENNHKRTISRLIIGKIISSSSAKWMASKSYDKISTSFLSSEPEKEIYVSYRIKKPGSDESAYGNEILTLDIGWFEHEGEILDPEGNVWKSCQLKINPNICSTYGDRGDNFDIRAACIAEVRNLVSEIREMVPGPIRTMILDNSERIDRDNKRIYDDRCWSIRGAVSSWGLTKNLRKGGSPHIFSRDKLKDNISAGKYEIHYESGTKRNPVVKKYIVTIPENPSYLVSIRRTA